MRKVAKNSPVPKYYQLKEILKEMIENEELKPGDSIPTEMELCGYHEVSRMTARKAIQCLVYEGLLYREQGRGTYIAHPKEKRNVSQLLSFTEEMRARGEELKNKVLLFEEKAPNKKILKLLNFDKSTDLVYEIKRLRIVSGIPVAIESAHIPNSIAPGLLKEDIERNSLYNLLENKYAVKLSYGKQSVEPVILTSYECDLLGINENKLGLLFERVTYSENNQAIEYTKSIYRSDIYKLEQTLMRKL